MAAGAMAIAIILIAFFSWRAANNAWTCDSIGRMCRDTFVTLTLYNELYSRLPKDNRPPHANSWRFQIQRFIEDVHTQPYELDASWEASENRSMREQRSGPHCLTFPNSVIPVVVAVVGPDTCWTESSQVSFGQISDDYIMLVGGIESNFHWMEPKDVGSDDFVRIVSSEALGELVCRNRIHVCFADGDVWELRTPVPANLIRQFVQLSQAAKADRNVLLPFKISDPT